VAVCCSIDEMCASSVKSSISVGLAGRAVLPVIVSTFEISEKILLTDSEGFTAASVSVGRGPPADFVGRTSGPGTRCREESVGRAVKIV